MLYFPSPGYSFSAWASLQGEVCSGQEYGDVHVYLVHPTYLMESVFPHTFLLSFTKPPGMRSGSIVKFRSESLISSDPSAHSGASYALPGLILRLQHHKHK
jgi:hypothetical protein